MGDVICIDNKRPGDVAEYFAMPDTPAADSPVGKLMFKVLEKFPGFTYEQARAKAGELLAESAGKRIYRTPAVLSDEEQETRRKAVRARFARSKPAEDAA